MGQLSILQLRKTHFFPNAAASPVVLTDENFKFIVNIHCIMIEEMLDLHYLMKIT